MFFQRSDFGTYEFSGKSLFYLDEALSCHLTKYNDFLRADKSSYIFRSLLNPFTSSKMVSGSVVVVLGLLFTVSNVQSKAVKADGDQDWWKTAVFYQIYPRSFKDSNGDGIGDIQGIISKLDHLKDAGITATWLSPIYKSPQVDQGYDISDYTDIHYEYGTIEDVDELIKAAHDLGIKVIMDFVPNHSSHEHPWFLLSENRTSGYEDYYIWRDGVNNSTPPNNWVSHLTKLQE